LVTRKISVTSNSPAAKRLMPGINVAKSMLR
jgi:hypothetical protein